MKNKKILMILVGFLASIILVSCGLRISDTVQDVTSEIRQETPKEDTEDLGIKQVLEQKKGENVDISTKDFTMIWTHSKIFGKLNNVDIKSFKNAIAKKVINDFTNGFM